jgi:hypothetical protein
MSAHTLPLEESERQIVLMALAMLSLKHPGRDDMLNRIALRIDNDKEGRAEMFDMLRRIRSEANARKDTG